MKSTASWVAGASGGYFTVFSTGMGASERHL